jgi:hypothetical protein
MNWERQLSGINSYARELGFDPLAVVTAQAGGSGRVRGGTTAWLDLCCGSGRALIQGARQVHEAGMSGRVVLAGVDLVDAFDAVPGSVPGLELAVRAGAPAATRRLRSRLRAAGFAYSARRHQVTCTGRRDVRLPYTYLGADDSAGPGYAGQPTVISYYAEDPCRLPAADVLPGRVPRRPPGSREGIPISAGPNQDVSGVITPRTRYTSRRGNSPTPAAVPIRVICPMKSATRARPGPGKSGSRAPTSSRPSSCASASPCRHCRGRRGTAGSASCRPRAGGWPV